MFISLFAAVIYFIAGHGGPADHFATFAEELTQRGHEIEVHACGPALKKFQERKIEPIFGITPFSLENETAEQVAKKCVNADIVITDVGHPFDIPLQEALKNFAPHTLRVAYYDNPEPYVPGGYSATAAKVMLAADLVLFANANLTQGPIYQAPNEEVPLDSAKKVGIGYYPIAYAEKIAHLRTTMQKTLRSQFFSTHGLKDSGQKILVYAGGNNDEYFSKALPAFLKYFSEASEDLSEFIILLQQHPGAKEKNLDGMLIKNTPQAVLSNLSSEDALIIADTILYYQTSMAPQFILAKIPTIQVGHNIYEDIVVKSRLCSVATSSAELLHALKHPKETFDSELVKTQLGLCSDWADVLESTLGR